PQGQAYKRCKLAWLQRWMTSTMPGIIDKFITMGYTPADVERLIGMRREAENIQKFVVEFRATYN
ncbi:hypothetical protein E4U43_006780, partial [Claviceps pusilla]